MSLLQPWISWQPLFNAVRFFVGFALAGSGAVKLWISEIVPFQRRCAALLAMEATFFASFLATASVAAFICSWRIVVVVVALLPFLTLPLSCFTAESFKWLESRNEFSLYPRVFARFVDEEEIEALRGKTKTCKISEKDKRWRRDERRADDDEDLCFKQEIRSPLNMDGFKARRRPTSDASSSTIAGESTALSRNFPMTPNHLRRLNRRAASPTTLAPILGLSAASIFVVTSMTALVVDFGDDRIFVMRKHLLKGEAIDEASTTTTTTMAYSPLLLICVVAASHVTHAVILALRGRVKPIMVAMILSSTSLACRSVFRLVLDRGVFESTADEAIDWDAFLATLGFFVVFSSIFALRAIHFLTLEIVPVQYRGRAHGFLHGIFWLSLLLILPWCALVRLSQLALPIATLILAVISAICGPLFCRFPNLASTPLPQDMEDFHFSVESSRLYDQNGCGDRCRCCCRCSSRVRRMDYWS